MAFAIEYMIDVVDRRIAFIQCDIQPFLGLECLLQGGIVAGELELMEPFELYGYFFRGIYKRVVNGDLADDRVGCLTLFCDRCSS